MQQIEIFKTNVNNKSAASNALQNLSLVLPECEINFDLDDCDKVLRIAGQSIDVQIVLNCLSQQGYQCELIQ